MIHQQVFSSIDALAEAAGEIWLSMQTAAQTSEFWLASPLSNTPRALYAWVIRECRRFQNWEKFRFVMMDEQLLNTEAPEYVPADHPASFIAFARRELLNPLRALGVPLSSDPVIIPELSELARFDAVVTGRKGIDLLVLAVGLDGHYAQVMPGTRLNVGYHVANLPGEYIDSHTRTPAGAFFGTQFSPRGMSLGPQQVLGAQRVLVILSGATKRAVTRRLLNETAFNPEFPISIVLHPDLVERVTILMTEDVT